MLLELTTTQRPATDLGFLLHKNPARAQSLDLGFGRVHIFYPEATAERCTAALLLDVDSVGLVRGKGGPEGEGGLLRQYVNDRPYVASSFLSVAIARAFGSALKGESKPAAAELAEARRLVGDDRYSSITRLRNGETWGAPKIRTLVETTYFAGLRKAGVPDE